jgi:hypothetical protein
MVEKWRFVRIVNLYRSFLVILMRSRQVSVEFVGTVRRPQAYVCYDCVLVDSMIYNPTAPYPVCECHPEYQCSVMSMCIAELTYDLLRRRRPNEPFRVAQDRHL